MSTDHQQYSTANQKDAIARYAAGRGIDIVATYEDAGKSGLTISGRPALRQLIADVAAGQDQFETILVYDVSRWGRFQDADESAHLEYLCRLSGVQVEYCAEPFVNDGTPFSSVCKVLKRALAAEYSRELSTKVYAGKRRLIELGFRQGGTPGFGLRRCLISASGERKGLLARGEYKSIATDRTILVPGPPEEVAIVHRIYDDYVRKDLGAWSISYALNREGIRSESGGRWTEALVKRVLTSEKYVGDSVWGRQSCKLKTAHRNTDPSTWVRYSGAFEPIVSRELFEKAQRVRAKRARRVSNDDVLRRLQRIYAKHGEITVRLIKEDGYLSSGAIRERFGSLERAYIVAGLRPSRDLSLISSDGSARRLREAVSEAVSKGVAARGGSVQRLPGRSRFLINDEITASISVSRLQRRDRQTSRWYAKRGGTDDDLTIMAMVDGQQECPTCYYFFPATAIGKGLLLAGSNPIHVEVFRSDSLEPLWRLCTRCDPAGPVNLLPDTGRIGSTNSPPVRALAVRLRPSRQAQRRAGAGAFVKTTKALRSAIAKADLVAIKVYELRRTLTKLLGDARFVRILALQGISSVPYPIFRTKRERDEHGASVLANVRQNAIELISGDTLSHRARTLLERIEQGRRIEAGEVMVLTNDFTDLHTLSLIHATPKSQLLERWPGRANGPGKRLVRTMITEGAYTYREAMRALPCSGYDAIDRVVLVAFVRKLMANRTLASWLERNARRALPALASALHR